MDLSKLEKALQEIKDALEKNSKLDDKAVADIKAKYGVKPQVPYKKEFENQVAAVKEKYKNFSVKKDEDESLSFNKGGQWSLDKSNYGPKGAGLYSPTDNINRKENRTGEVFENVGQNKAAHRYTTSASSVNQAHLDAEAKKRKKNPAPVKTFSPEEIKAAYPNEKVSKDEKPRTTLNEETKNFLDHWEPATKHPKEPTAGMPEGKKPGQKITPTGFKLKVVKDK